MQCFLIEGLSRPEKLCHLPNIFIVAQCQYCLENVYICRSNANVIALGKLCARIIMDKNNSGKTGDKGPCWAVRVWRFYVDGFRSMTIGRYLWAIILIKLFILFFVMRLFFFPNILERDYENDADRAQAVRTNLINDR